MCLQSAKDHQSISSTPARELTNIFLPIISGFTKFVTQCSNSNSGDANFGNNFGCWGPWTGYSDDYYQFALSEYSPSPPLPIFAPISIYSFVPDCCLLTFGCVFFFFFCTTDSYIGVENGHLTC